MSYQLKKNPRDVLKMLVPLSAVGAAIDFYILLLPIVAVMRLQIARKRRIGLCLVFGTGSM